MPQPLYLWEEPQYALKAGLAQEPIWSFLWRTQNSLAPAVCKSFSCFLSLPIFYRMLETLL